MSGVTKTSGAKIERARKGRGRRMLELAAAATVSALLGVASVPAWAGPNNVQVQNVARGKASFNEVGNTLNIRASDRAIINYRAFDISKSGAVQFIQPSRDSRVLNRINSTIPSSIDGRISANGSVYFVNPSGITFGPNAVINVGKHFAGIAGNVSDGDFVNGVNRFQGTGLLSNSGQIVADAATLVGRRVENMGSVAANVVVMAAGDEILMGPRAGQVFVKMNSADAQAANGGGGTTGLGAGDLYSLALTNTGAVTGNDVTFAAGSTAGVRLGGIIDASSATGAGGTIRVLGGEISLAGATLNASGATGGGNVRIGGDFHGAGELPTAQRTFIDEASFISADAIDNGGGGQVVVWADQWTRFAGRISARGGATGGDGGFVEVSGKLSLQFRGLVDTGAPAGAVGTVLLDPETIRVVDTGANDDQVIVDGDDATVTAPGGAGEYTISDEELEGIVGTIMLTATKDIIVDEALTLTSGDITFDAGQDIDINAMITTAGADLTLTAGRDISLDAAVDVGGGKLSAIADRNIAVNANMKGETFEAKAAQSVAGTLTLGAYTITSDSILLQSGHGDSLEQGTISGITSPTFEGFATPASRVNSFTVQQDGDVADANLPNLTQFSDGVANNYTIKSKLGSITAADGTKFHDAAAPAKRTKLALGAGTAVNVNSTLKLQSLDATGSSIVINNSINDAASDVQLTSSGKVQIKANITTPSLAVLSGTDGTGDVSFGAGVTISASSQSYTAGDGTGGSTAAKVDAHTNNPSFASNVGGTAINTYIIIQDADASDTAPVDPGDPAHTLPNQGQFPVALLPQAYTIRSKDHSVYTSSPLTDGDTDMVVSAETTIFVGGAWTLNSYTAETNVRISGDVTLTVSEATFQGTVDSKTGGNYLLHVTGNGLFAESIGASRPLKALVVDGVMTFDGDSVATTQDQMYGDTLTISKDDVTFSGVNGTFDLINAAAGGDHDLTLSFTGLTTVGALDDFDFQDFKSNAGGTIEIPGNTKTTGVQTYDDDVKVTATGTLQGTSLKFNKKLDAKAAGVALTMKGPGTNNADVTFSGAVGSGTRPQSLDLQGALKLMGPSVETAAGQIYVGNIALDGVLNPDKTLLGSSVQAKSSIAATNEQTLTFKGLNADGTGAVVTFAGVIGSSSDPLGKLEVKGTTRFETGEVFTSGTQTYGSTVTLTQDLELTGSEIIFPTLANSVLGGGQDLTLNSSTQKVGPNIDNVMHLETDADGTTYIFGDLDATTSMVFNDKVLLTADAIVTSNTIHFEQTLDSQGGLTGATFAGTVTFDGEVGGSQRLAYVTVTGPTNINGEVVWTTGPQQYAAVSLGDDATLQGTTAAFAAIDGNGHDLTLNFSGNATFNAVVTEVQDLTTDGTSLAGGAFAPAGNSLIKANVGTPGISKTIKFNDAVQLQVTPVTIAADNSVEFASTIDGAAALTVTTAAATFGGKVGDTTALNSLAVSDAATIKGGWVETTGAQTYSGDVTLNAPVLLGQDTVIYSSSVWFKKKILSLDDGAQSLTVNGPFATPAAGSVTFAGQIGTPFTVAPGAQHRLDFLTVNGITTLASGGGSITTKNDQTYNYSLGSGIGFVLGANTTLEGFDADFNTRLAGNGFDLTLNFYGIFSVNDKFAGLHDLITDAPSFGSHGETDLDNDAQITTTGKQEYHDPVKLIDDPVKLSGSKLIFHEALDGNADLTLVGDVTLYENVGKITALKSLDVSGTTTTIHVGTLEIHTTGTQHYQQGVTLGSDTDIFATAVDFDSTINGGSLDINNDATFGGAISTGHLSVGGKTSLGAGTVTTAGGTQTYTGEVTLTSNNVLTGTSIGFGNVVKGAFNLTSNGATTFSGFVGAGTKLNNLTVNGNVTFGGGGASTNFDQTYNGSTTLLANAAFDGDDIAFNGAINGAAYTLHVTGAGSTTFGGPVTVFSVLSDGAGATAINGGLVTTTDFQTYTNAVTIGQNTTLTSTSGALVSFGSTLNSQAGETNTLGIAAKARFNNVVGGVDKLQSLSVSLTTNMNAGTVNTVGAQVYSGAVTLEKDTNLNGASASFGDIVNGVGSGTEYLKISGDATFGGNVGAAGIELESLTVGGNAAINGSFITTKGAAPGAGYQTYSGDVTLGGTAPGVVDKTLTGSQITFVKSLKAADDGVQSLHVVGDVNFNGQVGTPFTVAPASQRRLKFLTIDGKTSVTGNGSITTKGDQTYTAAGTGFTLGVNTTLEGNKSVFNTALAGNNFDLTLNFYDVVKINSTFAGIKNLTTDAPAFGTHGKTQIDLVGTITTTGEQNYHDPVELLDPTVNLTATKITFHEILDGNSALVLNTPSAIFQKAVGGGTALNSLLVTGTTAINGGLVKSNNGQTYQGAVTLGGATSVIASLATFNSTINGGSLAVTGSAAFNGAINTGSLSVSGTTGLGAGTVTTSTFQTYSGDVQLTTGNVLNGTSIFFGARLYGAQNLTITAANTTFRAHVGDPTALNNLTVNGAGDFYNDIGNAGASTSGNQIYNGGVTLHGNASFDGAAVTYNSPVGGDSNLTVTAGAININGGTVTTPVGFQTYNGAVRLGQNTTTTGTLITFGGTLNSEAGEINSLLVAGNARLNGAVGTLDKLTSLTVNGTTAMNAGTVTTQTFQTYTGAVTVESNTTMNASVVNFGSTVDDLTAGAHSLQINAATANFANSVGAGKKLVSLGVTGDSNVAGPFMGTTGGQTYGGFFNITGDVKLEAATALFNGRVYSTADGANFLEITAGTTTFQQAVGHDNGNAAKRLEHLLINGNTIINGGSVTTIDDPPAGNPTAGWQTYNGTITLGDDTIFQGTTAHFGGNLDGTAAHFDLTLNFSRDYTIGSQLVNIGDLTTDGLQFNGTPFGPKANTLIDGSFTTFGTQTYIDDVRLLANATLKSTGTHFQKTLSGPFDLTLDFHAPGGVVTFSGDVGAPPLVALASLTVNGSTLINGAGATRIIQTTGAQYYGNTVTLAKDTQVIASVATYAGTINGAAGNQFLTISGNAVFQNVVGTPSSLQYLTVSGTTSLGAGVVNTVDGQTYSGAVTLTSNNILNAGQTIFFGNTVDGGFNLTLNGNTVFKAYVGHNVALANLTANGTVNIDDTHPVITPGGVKTSANQIYNGLVTLDSDATMVGANITFNDPVRDSSAGVHNLIVTASNLVSFNDKVGDANKQLKTLLSNGAGVTAINGFTIDTTLTQTYETPVTLGNDAVLTGTLMFFGDTINSETATQRSLKIAGNASFNGQVGTAHALKDLLVTGTTFMNAGIVTTGTTQTYTGAVTLAKATTLNGTLVTFISTVDGGFPLIINADAFFGGAAGGAAPIASLIVNGDTNINGPLIHTSGFQTYNGTVKLSSGATFGAVDKDLIGTDIAFNGNVDAAGSGVQSLTIDANNMFANAAIGSATPLKFLQVNATSWLNEGHVTTTQYQHYNGIVNLGANALLKAGTDIIFEEKVYDPSVGDHTLTATANNITQFKAPVGADGKALLGVLVNGPTGSQTHFGEPGGVAMFVTTTGTQVYENASTLMVNTTLQGSSVTFGKVVGGTRQGGTVKANSDGGQFLKIEGNAFFNGNVGVRSPLASRPSTLWVTGTTNINTDNINTTSNQQYDGAVTLGANVKAVELTLNGATALFGSTVDALSTDLQRQSLLVTGNAQFGGNVGAGKALSFVHVTLDTTLIAQTITTTTTQNYDGDFTLAGSSDKTLTGTVVTFGTESSEIGVNGLVDSAGGAKGLTVAGNAVFNGNVGSADPLEFALVTKDTTLLGQTIDTTGAQTYLGSFTLRGKPSVAAKTLTGDTVQFGQVNGGTRSGGVIAATNNGVQSLTVNVNNGVTFNGDVGVASNSALASLTVNGVTHFNTLASKTTGNQLYNGAVILGPNVGDSTMTAANAIFTSTLDASSDGAQSLTIAGNAQFDDNVGGIDAIKFLTVQGTTLLNGKTVDTTSSNASLGSQHYVGNVTLGGSGAAADKVLTASSFITFDGWVHASGDGAQSLTLNAKNATFNSDIGGQGNGSVKLNFLAVNADANFNGAFITTTDFQTFAGNVTLSKDNLLTAGSTITFGPSDLSKGKIDGAHALSLDAVEAIFNGDVGKTTALSSLTVDAAATLNAETFKTTGQQHYLQNVTLGDNSAQPLVLMTASNVLFDSTLDAESDAGRGLSITGNVTFEDVVGAAHPLGALSVSGVATINGGAISTQKGGNAKLTGDQTYTNVGKIGVILGADTVLVGQNGNFNMIVNGRTNVDHDFTLNFLGDAAIGSNFTNINDLTTDATGFGPSGNTFLSSTITTSGNQTYNDTAVLTDDTTLQAQTGAVSFGLTVDGNSPGQHSLTIDSPQTTFHGDVGASSSLESLSITGASTLDNAIIHTANAQAYAKAVNITTGVTLTVDNTDAAATFVSTVDGASLTVNGDAFFGAAVNLGFLSITGTTDINGGSVTTTGKQAYGDAVTLGKTTALNASGVTFGGTLDGAFGLTITAGNVAFNGAAGSIAPLTSLDLRISSAATQNAPITAGALLLSGNGDFTLSNDSNRVNTLTISEAGSVDYHNDTSLTLSDGATSARNLSVRVINGDLTAGDVTTSAGGNITLIAGLGTTPFNLPLVTGLPQQTAFLPDHFLILKGDLTAADIKFAAGNVGTPGQGIITLGGDFANVPFAASIMADPQLTIMGREVTMGLGQKLTVVGKDGKPGDLNITAFAANLSDITVQGKLTIDAGTLSLVQRDASNNLAFAQPGGAFIAAVEDNGTDFVGDQIEVTLHGGNLGINGLPPFAAVKYSVVPGLAPRRFDGNLTDEFVTITFQGRDYLVDLKADGPAVADLGTSFAIALPAEMPTPTQESAADPAQKDVLYQMGIWAKDNNELNFIEWLVGRGLYDDAANMPNAQRANYKVTPNRLPREIVSELVVRYTTIYNPLYDPDDEKTVSTQKLKSRCEHLKHLLELAVADYRATRHISPQAKLNMADVREFIQRNPKHAEIAANLAQVETLINRLDILGLSRAESELARLQLLGLIKPDKMRADQMMPLVMKNEQTAARRGAAPAGAGVGGGVDAARQPGG